MIIYFADKDLNLTGQASTNLPGGFRLFDDMLTEDIESGVNTFEFRISYSDKTRQELEAVIANSKYILKSGGDAFIDKENSYTSLFQIIDDEFDTLSQEYYVYAEDAGLDLLNKTCPAVTFTGKTLSQMLSSSLPAEWTVNLIGTPAGTKTYTFDGENTATERINSIAGIFGCEVYYSFEIERFKVTKRILNVIPRRGKQKATTQLRLNKDVNQIVTKRSRQEMATAFAVTGGTPEGKETPINLKGYSYSYTDPDTGDVYSVDTSTGQMRNTSAMKREASAIDTDGLIVKTFEFDTTSKSVLAGQARAELQKVSEPTVEYEIDVVSLPEGTQLGDRVNVIDEDGKLYLDARILKIETSVANISKKITTGEYIRRSSGISAQMRALAKEYASKGIDGVVLAVTSSGGNIFHGVPISTTLSAAVYSGTQVLTSQDELTEMFGDGASIKWYREGTLLGSGMTYRLNSSEKKDTIKARLEI